MIVTALALVMMMAEIERAPLADIEVGAPGDPSHFVVSISLERNGTPATREEWRTLVWYATRKSGDGEVEISSESCPALRTVAEAFRELPPITPTPHATIVRDEPLPLNGILLHGWNATVSFRTFAGAQVTTRGSEAYSAWASNTLNELVRCWPEDVPNAPESH